MNTFVFCSKKRVSAWCRTEEIKRCVLQKEGLVNKKYTVVARNMNRNEQLPTQSDIFFVQ
jgi:hypothetical protein